MLLSLSHISFRSSKSMILKAIWLLTTSVIIRWAIPTAIRSSLTYFVYKAGFCCSGRGPVETRSHTSFSICMDFVIIDHIGQFAKPVSFSRLAWFPPLLEFDSSAMAKIRGKTSEIAYLERCCWWGNSFRASGILGCFC